MTKRVLITGAAGFAGHHLVEHLLATTDWQLVCLDGLTYAGDIDRLTAIGGYDPTRVEIHWHDLRSPIGPALDERLGRINSVLHLAANSHVERSITDPVPFVMSNVAISTHLLDWARLRGNLSHFIQISTDEVYGPAADGHSHTEWEPAIPSNPYAASKAAQEAVAISYWRTFGVPVVITNCWDPKTRVLTPDGPKGYEDLQIGDLVFAVDANENMVLEPVMDKVQMPGPPEMIRFQSRKIDQLVTPNHRMMFRRTVGRPRRWGPIEEAHAETLVDAPGRVAVPLTAPWQGNDQPTYCPAELTDLGPVIHDKALPDEVSAEWLARIMGWFVSEGWTNGTTVCLGGAQQGQKEELAELLAEIGDGVYEASHGRSVHLAWGQLARLLDTAGKGAKNKRVPGFIKDMAPKYLELFLDCALRGDGQRRADGTWVYYTASESLAWDISEVAMKCGWSTRIQTRETWDPSKTVKSESWMVRLRKARAGATVERGVISRETNTDPVWCVSVPSGRVFIERNGITSLTGQTMNLFGERQDPEKFVGLTMKRLMAGERVPVHAANLGYSEPPAGDGSIRYVYNKGGWWRPGSRIWLHARNHADALRWLLVETTPASYGTPGVDRPDRWHVAGQEEVDNLTMVEKIAKILGVHPMYDLVDFHSSRPGHDLRYSLDGSKLIDAGWKPPVSFDEALVRTVTWTQRLGR